jgi:hypothetical protein
MEASHHLRIYHAALQRMAAAKSLTLKSEYLKSAIVAEGLSEERVGDDAYNLLRTSADRLSADEIEALLILAPDLTASTEGIAILNHLILLHNHQRHEDIARLLQRGQDPSSVHNVSAAIEQKFDYLAWDEDRALARKCMWALRAIGTAEAWSEIERYSRGNDPVIAEWAKEQLDRRTP